MTQVRPPLLHLTLEGQAVGVRAGEEVQHSCAVVQHVHRVLVVAPNGQVGVAVDCALGGGDVACHQLQQG